MGSRLRGNDGLTASRQKNAPNFRGVFVLAADQNFISSSARSTTEVGVMVVSLSLPLAST
jgi:hypothetical protein